EQHNEVRQNYSAMVENIDRWLGIYIEKLRERGELENTLIVFSSDHGEMLGDHGYWEKHRPYQPSIGVPFITAGPGVREGSVIDVPITILDLTATFLDYGEVPRQDGMDSRSMRPLFEGQTNKHRDYVLSAMGDWRLVYDGRFKLVQGYGNKPLLFDLKNDPFENNDIFMTAKDEANRLSAELKREAL
ncbi:MAG: sulfatase-like hydrolase/transferase, partial [Deltaproteobacteria bacterium]|nr:sulfatase-like hydrolase/transferase [Deltaproteobacteria bacterium]